MIPKDLLYSKTHEWVKIEGGIAVVGITYFAQEQLGDITYVDLPKVGTVFEAGQEMGSVESVKAASELYCPVSGEVMEINPELDAAPEKINADPFGEGWMIKIKVADEPIGLLSPEEYAEIAQAEH
ncbi:glycine cleavage system protein GcvH [Desulfolutivibrio sulfoxidireducens]|uniref:glycine cleavage system protein GcvH n=1 Tax=Desulfolutivibrio sulfoxidireducens TaxID=2773299 RepID=UPI00159D6323|nr:glycine cleavage system protein GcvH [Desulfolutivibrio sulfoxidireducens]